MLSLIHACTGPLCVTHRGHTCRHTYTDRQTHRHISQVAAAEGVKVAQKNSYITSPYKFYGLKRQHNIY